MSDKIKAASRSRQRPKHIRLSAPDRVFFTVSYATLTLLTLIVLYPIVYVLAASFSSGEAVTMGKVFLWPVDFSIDGYRKVFGYRDVFIGYRNTIFYTVAGTCINILMTLICAYPLARKGLPHKGLIMLLFTFTMVFGGGLIPTYLVVNSLRMVNTVWALLIPGAMAVYQMIITRTFLQSTIPDELLESAKIDGCNDFLFFSHFILPLSKAVIAVIALQYAVGHWNRYFDAMIYLFNKQLQPLQIFLRQILVMSQFDAQDLFDQETSSAIQGMKDLIKYSLIVVSTVPILCVYPFLQKYFVQGVMIGSLKG